MQADDLLPLFLSEATDRLDRLDHILRPVPPQEGSEEWRSARRELHTLKGAGRMMGLADIAEACHRAEDAFDGAAEQGLDPLLNLVQEIRAMVEAVGAGPTTDREERRPQGSSRVPSVTHRTESRIPREILDRVSDQTVRLSFLGRGVGALVEEMYAVSRTAAAGANDRHPEQVLATLALRLRRLALKVDREHNRFERLVDRQLSSLLSIQVQPVKPLLSSLGRHAEELATSLGKSVDVQVEATRCRLDRRIMEALKEVLLHLVANAVDHGIEPESERLRLGKNPTGSLKLHAVALVQRVRLTVSDDGRGVDTAMILERAVDRGLVTPEDAAVMSEDGIRQLLFQSGFSTRETASPVSGRGIGLDSVAEAVRKIGGEVWMDGTPGEGFRVTLDLPLTRRGESILLAVAGGLQIGIPAHQVIAFSGPGTSQERSGGDQESEGRSVHRVHLGSSFGSDEERGSVVVHSKAAGIPIDVVVDSIVGEEEVFLHPWPRCMDRVKGTDALALTGAGTPIAILDLQYFLQSTESRARSLHQPAEKRPAALRLLLVDDSRITREMFRRILTDAEMTVVSVASGEEALAVLENGDVDCVVTDIEMPGIDGLELTRRIRESNEWEHLPVVVVSTRDRPSDRMAGLEAGADAYFAKQTLESGEFVALIQRIGGRR